MFYSKNKKSINAFLLAAESIGLRDEDANNAKDYIKHREYELSFEIIVEQLYEFDIEINKNFYDLALKVAENLDINEDRFIFLKELIRDDFKIPKPVNLELSKIIASLSKK